MGEAEEAVVVLNNGMAYFTFQNPFVITEEDVANGTTYTLDLVFNPKNIIKAHTSETPDAPISDRQSPSHCLQIPQLELTPVPHKTTETTSREMYLIHFDSGTPDDAYDIRLSLYYVTQDTEKTIYGIETEGILTGLTGHLPTNIFSIVSMGEETDGSLTFKRWDESVYISGVTRLSSIGAASTLSISTWLQPLLPVTVYDNLLYELVSVAEIR